MLRSRTVPARRTVAGLAVATGVAALLTAMPATPAAGAVATREQVMSAAARYAQSRGYHIAVSVLDTRTGRLYGSGSHTSTFASESVVKTMIATRLLLTGRMHGTNATRAYKMITQSDDAIASAFYGSVGGDSLINWIKAHYNIPSLGSPPRRANWWGNTHITSDGLVRFYAKVKADRRVGPWLLNAMHHARHYGSDGQYQYFGLPSATTGTAFKQGWGADYDDWGNSSDFNTTGFINGDRYAVAILARGSISHYGADISRLLTGTARTLLPGGVFPSAAPVLSFVSHHSGPIAGGTTMLLRGSGFTGVRAVYFGRSTAPVVHVVSSTTISVRTPAHAAGTPSVQVVTTHGNTRPGAVHFHFVAPPVVTSVSPAHMAVDAGSRVRVTIRGANLWHVTAVSFGSAHATTVHVVSPTVATVYVPRHDAGVTDVRIRTWYGTSLPASADRFTYDPVSPTPAPSTSHPPSTSPSSTGPSSTSSSPPSPTSSSPSGTTPPATTPVGAAPSSASAVPGG